MKERLQTASQDALPPRQETLFDDPLVVTRTRFSSNRTHRYTLFRYWAEPENYCAFIGMNPSGADESHIDRTVGKCVNMSKRWNFGALYMLNAFAVRSTNSDELFKNPDPVGPDNDKWIRQIASKAKRVVVAWGKPGRLNDRDKQVEAILRSSCNLDLVFCFGKNKDGTPAHPLYQPLDKTLIRYFE